MSNLFNDLPSDLTNEYLEPVVSGRNTRIERIISNGHATPSGEWCDQPQNEWVMVLNGRGEIEFEKGRTETLRKGEHLLIGEHARHRVSYTEPKTIWLAVHFD